MTSREGSGRDLSAAIALPVSSGSVNNGLYRIAALERYPELLHGISTRLSPANEDWNLSTRRGTPQHPPSWNAALRNRHRLAEALGISLDRVVGCQQMHGTEVALVTATDGGRGMTPDRPAIPGTDGMITDTPGLYLLALSADCPPVFFYDPVRRAVGLAHSGWKGTAGRISANVVEAMVDNFGSEPSDIIAAIGPGIGPCCYHVGPNVIEAVEASFHDAWDGSAPILEARDGHTYFNLRETIRRTLIESGVPPQNVTVEGVCTAHNLDLFYSHRGEAGQCGLFGAVIGLRDT